MKSQKPYNDKKTFFEKSKRKSHTPKSPVEKGKSTQTLLYGIRNPFVEVIIT
jgi:hypothetical protein